MSEQITRYFDIADFSFHIGNSTLPVTLAYQTWGTLNKDKSNAILLNHALSGTPHASGLNQNGPGGNSLWKKELHDGWWNEFVGSGKALDTDKYFIISANYIGGCYGSTGPASINPKTGEPYGSSFPSLSISDQANAFKYLVDSFGIKKLHAAIGPSVGGLITLTYATLFPTNVKHVISIAAGFKTTVLNRLILFEQILAIENDPHFQDGDYYSGEPPSYGLALARMISHKTFVHLDAIERRARSEIKQTQKNLSWYKVKDPFQSYMLYQGKKFVDRFDANTYLRIIDMWSNYNAISEAGKNSASDLFSPCSDQKYLVFSIDSDFCFYPEEQQELTKHLEENNIDVTHITVHSNKGHDSFLLEPHLYSPQIVYALNS